MGKIDIQKLFEYAGEGALGLACELYDFEHFLNKNYTFKNFIENSNIEVLSRKKVFDKLFKKTSESFRELIFLLIERNMAREISAVSDKFAELVTKRSGIDFALLSTAFPLDLIAIQKITDAFGGNIRAKVVVDKNLLGGFVLKFRDGRVFDASLMSKLSKMKEEILR
jgi:ATP synthase F1 delta subunit